MKCSNKKLIFYIATFFLGFALSGNAAKPKKSTNSAYLFYTKGVELASRKKYIEAIEKFEKAINQNHNFAAAYIEYARALALQGKRTQALEKLEQALQAGLRAEDKQRVQQERAQLSELFYTNKTFQQYQNGLNFLRLERSGAAVAAFEKALTTEPDNVAILLGYAQAIQAEEGLSAGARPLERAFKINPEKKETRVMLAAALLQGEPERTISLLKLLVKAADSDEQTCVLYARALFDLSKIKEALDFLQERVEKNANWHLAVFWLGKMYSKVPESRWLARKYLMTYIKRDDALSASAKTADSQAQNKPNALREEAEKILSRVNEELQ